METVWVTLLKRSGLCFDNDVFIRCWYISDCKNRLIPFPGQMSYNITKTEFSYYFACGSNGEVL